MGHAACSDPLHISAQRQITRHLLPDKIERIGIIPDVGTDSGDAILALGWVVHDIAAWRCLAHAAVIGKDPHIAGLSGADLNRDHKRQGTERCGGKKKEDLPLLHRMSSLFGFFSLASLVLKIACNAGHIRSYAL